MSIIDSSTLLASGTDGYQISRSLRFNSADSAYLNRIPGSAGNRRTYTISMWVKRGKLGAARLFGSYSNANTYFEAAFDSNNNLYWYYYTYPGLSYQRTTSQVFRDCSAWMHLVFAFDSTNTTAADRMKIYANGQQITSFSATVNPSLNFDCLWNSTSNNVLGDMLYNNAPGSSFDGNIAEVYNIDGQALTPSSFGETDTITGVWKPKKYVGTYSGNSFYLNFSDNSGTTSTTLGKDLSGLGNNWTPNNFSVTAGAGNDSLIDTPTPYADGGNGRGNYCTLNPLTKSSTPTPSDGNLVIAFGGTYPANVLGTMGVSSGKWYWEVLFAGGSSANGHACGVAVAGWANRDLDPGSYSTPYSHYIDSRQYFANNSVTTNNSTSFTSGDIIGVALNVDSNQVSFYLNGSLVGSAQSLESNQTWFPFHKNSSYTSLTQTVNFGQRPFAYTPPSGFVALNTQNLPEPSIKKPGTYFNTVLWTGNGTSQSITGVGFQTDLLWSKARNQAYSHRLHDAVRGREQSLLSNSTGAEFTQANSITSFDADGFTVGNDGSHNGSGVTYVGWCWDESATPGFDIVTYTGNGSARTIAHSLGVAPSMMVIKRRDAAENWGVYHTSLGNTQYVYLDQTQGANASANVWNNTSPTSSVFSVAGSTVVNASGGTYVAYLWSEVAGFSKFGSYTGNGSTDGPFVFCNFRPRWLMIKRTDTTASWMLVDAARDTYNMVTKGLYPNLSDAEGTGDDFDFTSNGFKLRDSGTQNNASGGTYIFAAFAEAPFKYALAR
jgi:hypothetical protein